MFEMALGSALIYYAATQAFDLKEQHPETVRYTETLDSRNNSFTRMRQRACAI